MKTKILAFLLTVMITVVPLCACNSSDNNNSSLQTGDNTSTEGSEYPEIDKYVNELAAEYSYNGGEFCLLSSGTDVMPEVFEETGNLENDAKYKRAREIEEKFKLTFEIPKLNNAATEEGVNEIVEKVKQDVMSNLNVFDMVEGTIMLCGKPLLNEGLIKAVNDIEMIDLTQSWWIDNLEDQFSIRDKLFFLTGKMNISHYTTAGCILFNHDVVKNFNIPNLYEFVENGTWTLDKMAEIGRYITPGGETKAYMIDGASTGLAVLFGGGFRICEFDSDGTPKIPTVLSEDMIDYVQDIQTLFADDSITYNGDRASVLGLDKFEEIDVFIKDDVLFWLGFTGTVLDMRQHDVEFGILPMPKSTTSQENYIAYCGVWGYNGVFFPLNITDPTMSGVITEAMGALSEKYIEPAYYYKALKSRSTYDEESKGVLDILYSSKMVELCSFYEWGNVPENLNSACYGLNEKFFSGFRGSSTIGNNNIKKLIKLIDDKYNK